MSVGALLFSLTNQTAEAEAKFYDLSQKLNFTTESLSAVNVAAKLSGNDIEGIQSGLAIFDKNIGKAADGNKVLKKTFDELHISTKNNEQALRDAFKALAAMDEGYRQDQLAMQLFGKNGKEILGVIKQMGGDVDAATKKYAQMGLIIGGEAARAADRYRDQLVTLDLQMDAMKRTIGEQLIPVFFELTSALSDSSGNMSGLAGYVRTNVEGFEAEARVLTDVLLPPLGIYLESKRAIRALQDEDPNAIPAQAGIKAPTPVALPVADEEEMSKTALRVALEEAKRVEHEATADLKRELDARHISIDQFTKGAIGAAKQLMDAELAAIKARREVIEQEKPKDDTARKRISEEQLTLAQREAAALDTFKNAKKEAEAQQRREREKAESDHQQAILDAQVKSYNNQIEKLKKQIQDGTVIRAAGYKVIDELENASYEAQKAFLEKRRSLAGANHAVWQQFTDKLNSLEIDHTKTVEEQGRRRIEARDKEAEEELNRQLVNLKRDDEVKAAQDRREIARIKALMNERAITVEDGERRLADIEDKAADRRTDASLVRLRFEMKNLTSDPSKKNDVDGLSTDDLIKQARKASDTIGETEKEIKALETIRDLLTGLKTAAIDRATANEEASRRIIDAILKEQAATAPGAFGVETDKFKQKVVFDADKELGKPPNIDPWKTALGNLKSAAKDTFGSFTQGVGAMVQQWVLGADLGPKAMQKMVASLLAGLAAQATGKALWEGAEALAEWAIGTSLAANPLTAWMAPPHFLAATAHEVAAAAYGALAAGSAIGGRLINPGGSSGQGAGVGSNSVAGQAFSNNTTANSGPRVITENINQATTSNNQTPKRIDLHIHVSGEVDNAKMVDVVAKEMDPHGTGGSHRGLGDAVVNVITHAYHKGHQGLEYALSDAVNRY